MSDLDTFTELELAVALRNSAAGSYQAEAAVELLIAHGSWLRRGDFRAQAIWADGGADEFVVGIDWGSAAELLHDAPASASERRILSIALALVEGQAHPVDLGDALSSLDGANTANVIHAVAHAAGLHERHSSIVVNGHLDGLPDNRGAS
jgi:hypothetical protein